jgi:16S rRNA (guanine966-N2)-methyltransferase
MLSLEYIFLFSAIIFFMRVVAGKFGGRPLKTLNGKTTRPTTDKVKGAIFNMIGPFFEGGRVLDLFSGSGSLAIEAISRGMDEAILVEKDYKAQTVIQENIRMTKSDNQFILFKGDANKALNTVTGSFDLVLLDPPYAKEEIIKNITFLDEHNLLSEDAMIVCETDKVVDLPEEIASFGIWKQKIYGISKVTVYVR